MCAECRDYHRNHAKQWTDKHKEATPPDGMRFCQACKHYRAIDMFNAGFNGEPFVSCELCRARNKEWYNETRETRLKVAKEYNEREKDALQQRRKEHYLKNAEAVKENQRAYNNTPRGKMLRMIRNAARRNIPWELSEEDALKLISESCFYCGRVSVNGRVNSIDRLCSSGTYSAANCVSSCWPCNNAKGCLDPLTFLSRAVMMDALQSGRAVKNTAAHLWGVTRSNSYADYVDTVKRGEPFGISRVAFDAITARPCVHCARPSMANGSGRHGIDRIDNAIGYRVENANSSCRECNFMRGDMTLEAFREVLRLVAARADVIRACIPAGIATCVLHRVKRIRTRNMADGISSARR